MLGRLADAPEWATHYVEHTPIAAYWFVNFNNYRWTVFNQPDVEYTVYTAFDLVHDDICNHPDGFLVIELNIVLENE